MVHTNVRQGELFEAPAVQTSPNTVPGFTERGVGGEDAAAGPGAGQQRLPKGLQIRMPLQHQKTGARSAGLTPAKPGASRKPVAAPSTPAAAPTSARLTTGEAVGIKEATKIAPADFSDVADSQLMASQKATSSITPTGTAKGLKTTELPKHEEPWMAGPQWQRMADVAKRGSGAMVHQQGANNNPIGGQGGAAPGPGRAADSRRRTQIKSTAKAVANIDDAALDSRHQNPESHRVISLGKQIFDNPVDQASTAHSVGVFTNRAHALAGHLGMKPDELSAAHYQGIAEGMVDQGHAAPGLKSAKYRIATDPARAIKKSKRGMGSDEQTDIGAGRRGRGDRGDEGDFLPEDVSSKGYSAKSVSVLSAGQGFHEIEEDAPLSETEKALMAKSQENIEKAAKRSQTKADKIEFGRRHSLGLNPDLDVSVESQLGIDEDTRPQQFAVKGGGKKGGKALVPTQSRTAAAMREIADFETTNAPRSAQRQAQQVAREGVRTARYEKATDARPIARDTLEDMRASSAKGEAYRRGGSPSEPATHDMLPEQRLAAVDEAMTKTSAQPVKPSRAAVDAEIGRREAGLAPDESLTPHVEAATKKREKIVNPRNTSSATARRQGAFKGTAKVQRKKGSGFGLETTTRVAPENPVPKVADTQALANAVNTQEKSRPAPAGSRLIAFSDGTAK